MVSIEECRRIAKRRLPRGVFDYIDGAAEDERSLAKNVSAFARIEFRPRVLRDVSSLDHVDDDLRADDGDAADRRPDRVHADRPLPG